MCLRASHGDNVIGVGTASDLTPHPGSHPRSSVHPQTTVVAEPSEGRKHKPERWLSWRRRPSTTRDDAVMAATPSPWTLFTAPGAAVDADLVRAFVSEQAQTRLFLESRIVEFKSRRAGDNIPRAVAALANTDGGLILLGVDETNPDFDTSPGVPAGDLLAVASSCRQVLDPAYVPELIPVPLPHGDKIILVIRVDPAGAGAPIVKNGQVVVRAPGETVAASRDQIAELFRMSRGAAGPGATMSIGSRFTPSWHERVPGELGAAFQVRAASGCWLRHTASEAFTMSTDVRRELLTSFLESPVSQLGAWVDDRHRFNRVPVTDVERSSTIYHAAITYQGHDQLHQHDLRVVRDGGLVSFYVDVRFRLTPIMEPEAPPARIGRVELAGAILGAMECVAGALPDAVARAALDAPLRQDDVHVWVRADPHGLHASLDRGPWAAAASDTPASWGFTVPAADVLDSSEAVLTRQLTSLYLDLGMDNEDEVARQDVHDGRSMCEHARRPLR